MPILIPIGLIVAVWLAVPAGKSWADAQAERESDVQAPVVVQLDADGVQRAVVALDSHFYSPDHLVVYVGKLVELTLMSVTIITPHSFVLTSPEAGLDVNQNVGAGETVTVQFTPRQPGIFTFYCDKKLLFFRSHREKGMEGRLEVRE